MSGHVMQVGMSDSAVAQTSHAVEGREQSIQGFVCKSMNIS